MEQANETHTLVVEFPDGASPSYSAGMEVLGGTVVAVAFDGNRLEVADALLEALELVRMSAGWNEMSLQTRDIVRSAIAKASAWPADQ